MLNRKPSIVHTMKTSSTSTWVGVILVILTTLNSYSDVLIPMMGEKGQIIFVLINVIISILGYVGTAFHRAAGEVKTPIVNRKPICKFMKGESNGK